MHRLNALPGGWIPDSDGVIFIEQTPGAIIFLTAADTDIQSLAATFPHLPPNFATLRVVNLLNLQQPLSIDHYAEKVLEDAQIIILRLLGGRAYWSYGLEVLKALAWAKGISLWVLPGDDRPDLELMSHSTVTLSQVDRLWQYCREGGLENWRNGLQWLSNLCLKTDYPCLPPQRVPNVGLYSGNFQFSTLPSQEPIPTQPTVGILFYRSHYLAGNTLVIDALCEAIAAHQLTPIPVFVSSLRDAEVQEGVLQYFQASAKSAVQVVLNTTSFSLAKLERQGSSEETIPLWQALDVPILQVILSGGTLDHWRSSQQGLNPRDLAMNIALPEVDGRIITRAISFKAVQQWHEQLETDVVIYQPVRDRLQFVVDLAANWVKCRQTPISERKIALILANYPNKDGRLANGVGLDTPASCLNILNALKAEGYYLENIPATSEDLIQLLTSGVTNDLESRAWRKVHQFLDRKTFETYFQTLPENIRTAIRDRWSKEENLEAQVSKKGIPIAGIQLGNIFIGIQPSRGYDLDPSLNYHAPDLEPTPAYLAFYYWLKTEFAAQTIIHLGKHGNLEWLPGKSVALSAQCYPEIALGALPHFYPFIVNDPGEGSQAKRRSQAVIIDHLTPPLTRAELYGDLQRLETLIDEYYEARSLDPQRLPMIRDRLLSLLKTTQLHQDLGIAEVTDQSIQTFLSVADGYLCELKEAQIRDGLHILGECPQDQQLRDLIISIARAPSYEQRGLTQALAEDLELDFNPLTEVPQTPFRLSAETVSICQAIKAEVLLTGLKKCLIVGDVIEQLELYSQLLVDTLIQLEKRGVSLVDDDNSKKCSHLENRSPLHPLKRGVSLADDDNSKKYSQQTTKVLTWIEKTLLPALQKTDQEITHLLRGLNGQYVPSGASGAPTRGRPEVLPTGRNFYSVDIRAIPTETAWDVGRKAAEILIERYTQEQGEYPKTLAISIWGTSTMRTGGDDVSQVLALLGVKPLWDGPSRRVIDFEILPISLLNRPRIDVTVRISGFFRDSFPNLVQLMQAAIAAVSQLAEAEADNPLAAQVSQDSQYWQGQGFSLEQAITRSTYRIFGSKPGAYGAGLQGLIEAQNWQTDADLAIAYRNWSCYAYDQRGIGHAMPDVFQQRLEKLDIILHNQDNREHDLLDSDDYYQFQGGLAVAVRALTGKNPQLYFGDNSVPSNPKVKLLSEEIRKVYRSRVINPKWIAGVMRHGYKGAFEMAATVDYFFAYDATTHCGADFMYQGIADHYLLDPTVQHFLETKNPWALRDMTERLLEAQQRGLWSNVSPKTLDQLRAIAHQAEGVIEER
ncbi:MAG: cobaltochelatase subunit CobN [Snowella sp.]|nr:cobaltochelatase subunit CobN [Snowella sp.]